MPAPTQRVALTVGFDGPIERVFDAWLDPDVARHWLFATPDGEMVRAEIDPEIGGGFTMTERRDGQDVEHQGRFTLIRPPSRLGFELSVPAASDRTTKVDVSLMQLGGAVLMSLKHEDVPVSAVAATRKGWSDMMDRLADHFSAADAEAAAATEAEAAAAAEAEAEQPAGAETAQPDDGPRE